MISPKEQVMPMTYVIPDKVVSGYEGRGCSCESCLSTNSYILPQLPQVAFYRGQLPIFNVLYRKTDGE